MEIRDRKGDFVPQVKTFLHHATEGATFTAAAKAAGYDDPAVMARALVRNPEIMAQLLVSWQALGHTWKRLKGKAMKTLDNQLSPKVLKGKRWVKNEEYTPHRALAASKIVFDALLKGGNSIEDQAEKEDESAMKKGELVGMILGNGGSENAN